MRRNSVKGSDVGVQMFGGRYPSILRIEWATNAGRYEGATAEKAVPFPSCRPSILISILLRVGPVLGGTPDSKRAARGSALEQ